MKFTMLPNPWDDVIDEVEGAGHHYTTDINEAEFLIFNGGKRAFPDPLPENIGFVQWPFAGVDDLIAKGILTEDVRWANAAGVYSKPVAEVALGLIISQYHYFKYPTVDGSFDSRDEIVDRQDWLFNDKTVALFGAGGIARELMRMLEPFGVRTIAVNRSGNEVAEADRTVAMDAADDVWGEADIVVLSLPLTDETRGLVDAEKFERMKNDALVINVGRGALIDHDDLVDALNEKKIAGAAMDVTAPEPLPAGHPLWSMPNVVISPHIAAPPTVARMLIGAQIIDNAAAFERGEKMPTEVDAAAGY
ncbi:hypothetical protein C3B44_08925 [Corynebacterium yudongzhengii]|uniref:D-isomer specific 2-hydroxyacid dehydrogenase NAD-binding domain-containing protein n=1 Tax=Corynebacterium yudongzhengii TaxID=2080740 RepID=A0A2U1T8Z9_9CORY|nr:D-isomer specific 2-hydroxyacid dehydrogenase family protein [Corynebacterium yudongzhengii]AWB82454.1 hypothetical protein C3B44_08925 [Corynebacterium yudongzhengii]PWC02490.1 hypothetical protein DF222_02345 [Corynebacterium yudongzhengii]